MSALQNIDLSFEGEIAVLLLQKESNMPQPVTKETVAALNEALNHIEDHTETKLLLIKGAHPEGLTFGFDKQSFELQDENPHIHAFQKWEKFCIRLERLKVPKLLVARGNCQDADLQLMLACDCTLAVSETSFCIDSLQRGYLPGISLLNLAKHIGLGKAKQLILEAKPFGAVQALEWGIVQHIYEQEEIENALEKHINQLVNLNSVHVQLTRRLLAEAFADSYEDFLGNYLAAQHRAINR